MGFTKTEAKVIFFLIVVFFIGLSAKFVFSVESRIPYREFDYAKQDSLFYQSGKANLGAKDSINLLEKKVDSEQELLDFSDNNKKNENSKKGYPGPSRINLNKADIKALLALPGIGEKTAQKIINLRQAKGNFNRLDELMEVKGIGSKKFEAIKKYLFIE